MDKDNKKDKVYFPNFWFYEKGVNLIPATNKHDDPDLQKKPF